MNKKSNKSPMWLVVDEGDGVLNVISESDFDEDGYLDGYAWMDGYHRTDFDVVKKFRRFEDACRFVENELYNENRS